MQTQFFSTRKPGLLCLVIMLGLALHAAPAASQDAAQTTLYLPLVVSGEPPVSTTLPTSVFGAVMTRIDPARGLDDAIAAGARWIRSDNNLLWRDVEPVEGAGYHWDAPSVQLIEQEMINA